MSEKQNKRNSKIIKPKKKVNKKNQTQKNPGNQRDHREIGTQQHLFMFHPTSPGSCFFLPHGTIMINRLVEYLRKQYRKRGFHEVDTPNIFSQKLWETSGHWEFYQKNMFNFTAKDDSNLLEKKEEKATEEIHSHVYSLKPMNCPSHCLIFKSQVRSYRDLPLRFADFGVLHRNELSGALTGLTRVRKLRQDDAHIFCRMDQVEEEIQKCLGFLGDVYKMFGFDYEIFLSTKPDKFLGKEGGDNNLQIWENAENYLRGALDASGLTYQMNDKDGAFYGPKIDIRLKDSSGREHQCGTIQLDFQLPKAFGLRYKNDDETFQTPIIIHRAIYGSLERFFAILLEHYQGKFPFWLSPRQIAIVPVNATVNDYAVEIGNKLFDMGYEIDVNKGTDTFSKKVSTARKFKWNYILVIGNKEKENGTINVRHFNKQMGEMTLDQFVESLP